ncbi:hypothetical protein LLP99_22560 [Rouxiella badensis]|nr:hypothetical protein [Rouxiella badensis]
MQVKSQLSPHPHLSHWQAGQPDDGNVL